MKKKFTAATLNLCIELAERVGTLIEAHMYSGDFISVDGQTIDGYKFSITMNMKEDKEDGN